jgi:hypothetical protein
MSRKKLFDMHLNALESIVETIENYSTRIDNNYRDVQWVIRSQVLNWDKERTGNLG